MLAWSLKHGTTLVKIWDLSFNGRKKEGHQLLNADHPLCVHQVSAANFSN